MNGRAYLERLLAQEEAEGIAPALVDAQRLEARAAVAAQDVQRLRAKSKRTDTAVLAALAMGLTVYRVVSRPAVSAPPIVQIACVGRVECRE